MTDLRGYKKVVVITGAGISAPSGIKTYRQEGSAWTDAEFERMSHASHYGNHLPVLWERWGEMRQNMLDAEPNDAHLALTSAAARCEAEGGWLVVATQNVDGLHQRAGNPVVHELHGGIHRSRCMKQSCSPAFEDTQVPAKGEVPKCEVCGRKLRIDVVLFGEALRSKTVREVQRKLQEADLCLYVGTSGNVYPVSDMVSIAKQSGALCVLVNQEEWEHPHPDFHATLLGDASKVLPDFIG